ncbi:MAG: hypothetical protein COA78_18860 [Blastopirellula sp.]|nr:MAG: hypothetical protein COA78_18860 [Blastopirellula sp.]
MANKSWHFDRRTFLRGTGVAMALPFLECMAVAAPKTAPAKRMCGIYFPFGVSLPKEDTDQAKWRWFPKGEGSDFTFNESLKSLEPLRENLTVIGGLSHFKCRKMGAHDTGDTFLTGAELTGSLLKNTVSVDQVAAQAIGTQTRFSSLTISTDGGVGEPTRASTLSFNDKGRPIPALNQPQQIFDRMFGAGDADQRKQKRRLHSAASMLDLVGDHSKDIQKKLGAHDKAKFDEYLESVRQIEQRVARAQSWLEIPKPTLNDQDRERLELDADDQAPKLLMQTIYDLMYLALRTDSTRLITYQIASMGDGSSIAGKFPQLLGFKGNLHNLAHGWNKPDGAVDLGKWDQYQAEQLTYFLNRLKSAEEGEGTVLDNTMVLYGSSNSQTHNNNNYPLILAGGNQLGLKHNQFLKYEDTVPMTNLFVSMLNRLDVPTENFVDSTGELSELFV